YFVRRTSTAVTLAKLPDGRITRSQRDRKHIPRHLRKICDGCFCTVCVYVVGCLRAISSQSIFGSACGCGALVAVRRCFSYAVSSIGQTRRSACGPFSAFALKSA